MSDPTSDDLQTRIEDAIKNPRNLGEMKDADAIGTVGSADCGDMLRMWIKFKEEGGRKVIDRATFEMPNQYPEGIEYALVNGQISVDKGQRTPALAGHVLRGPGYRK